MRNWICLVSEFACLPVTRYPSVEPLQLAAMDSSLNVPEERVEEAEAVPRVDENIPNVQDEVPEVQSQAVDDDTSVAEPCCQLTELFQSGFPPGGSGVSGRFARQPIGCGFPHAISASLWRGPRCSAWWEQ